VQYHHSAEDIRNDVSLSSFIHSKFVPCAHSNMENIFVITLHLIELIPEALTSGNSNQPQNSASAPFGLEKKIEGTVSRRPLRYNRTSPSGSDRQYEIPILRTGLTSSLHFVPVQYLGVMKCARTHSHLHRNLAWPQMGFLRDSARTTISGESELHSVPLGNCCLGGTANQRTTANTSAWTQPWRRHGISPRALRGWQKNEAQRCRYADLQDRIIIMENTPA